MSIENRNIGYWRHRLTAPHRSFFLAMLLAASAVLPALGQAPTSVASAAGQPKTSMLPILDFRDNDIRFNLHSMMALLRDRNHEYWVLAAYPDPNTGRPLIGAGFSLDVAATDHPQSDPLNANQFIEPSSEQLWQAAGLDPELLRQILDQYNRHLEKWGKAAYRKKIRSHALPPQLTDEQAMRLLRISAIQAVVNARAYCRDFDALTGPRQMALSQLVFQMGINLEQFVEFLSELNGDTTHRDLALPGGGFVTEADHWKYVQNALIDSKWARLYSLRAATVIAMFDPDYTRNPAAAERRVLETLRPPDKVRAESAAHRSTHRTNRQCHASSTRTTSKRPG